MKGDGVVVALILLGILVWGAVGTGLIFATGLLFGWPFAAATFFLWEWGSVMAAVRYTK